MSATFDVRVQLARPDFVLQADLQLPASGITVLFGHSGSGKTTLLRCVAGLERAREARIVLAGEVWQDDASKVFVPPHKRALGYVFQEASLFSHLDVLGNLEYGMKRSRSRHARRTLDDAIELLGIGHLARRRVAQLSGGERQRVAIARALATGPRLLLLDEPMAALDAPRRQEILPWLEKLRAELKLPMLYVTHSVDELARLADHLVILQQGQVLRAGPALSVLAEPGMGQVLGDEAGALLHGLVAGRSAAWHLMRVDVGTNAFWLRDTGLPLGQPVRMRVPARDVSLTLHEPQATSIQNHFPCVVDTIAPDLHPAQVLVRVRCGEALLLARITRRALDSLALAPGSRAWAQVKSVVLTS